MSRGQIITGADYHGRWQNITGCWIITPALAVIFLHHAGDQPIVDYAASGITIGPFSVLALHIKH